MSAALSMRAVGKRYPAAAEPALQQVDLELSEGEIHALVGESGCGKTTLLRLAAGLEIPDGGTIHIGDRLVAGPGTWVQPERRGVGMVFQDLALFPHLRIADNVAFGLDRLPRTERRRCVDTLLDLAGLTALARRYPHQLSGGQQQRVALLRALAPRPRLLLLDEPFSSLDSPLRTSLRADVERIIREAGVPALVVLHDADDVFALADRVTVMRAGRVLQVGAPGDVYLEPVDDHVARLLGEANVLPVHGTADGRLLTPLGPVHCASIGECQAAGLRVCVRPEDVRVSRDAGDGPGATVLRVQFHRAGQRVLVKLDETACMLRCHLDLEGGRATALRPGDRVYVAARAERVRVFPTHAVAGSP